MCFGGTDTSTPTNPASYSLQNSHTAVKMEKTPIAAPAADQAAAEPPPTSTTSAGGGLNVKGM